MDDNYFFSNKSFEQYEENGQYNNSLFSENREDNLLHSINEEDDYEFNEIKNKDMFNNSFNNVNLNLNIDNSLEIKNNINNIFPENNSIKEISSIGQISQQKNDEDSSKNQTFNILNNSNMNNSSINQSNSSSTKEKSQIKNDINVNNIININSNENKKNTLIKKRKPRVHLEDLNIDPELIKDKKYQKIGDKVILSKNQVMTEEDKKEIRAIRNRISAQKSRDRKKAEFILLKEKIKILSNELNKKNLIIKNYENFCCTECKTKMRELNQKLIEDNDIKENNNINNNNNINLEEEGLIFEEDNSFILSGKKNGLLGKVSGFLIGMVCLIGITLCIFQGKNIFYNKSNNILNSNLINANTQNIQNNNNILRNLKEVCPLSDKNDSFIINDEDQDSISPIEENNIDLNRDNNDNDNNDNEFLQMCHDKFIFDVLSNTKKKKNLVDKQKSGFLVKKTYNKLDPYSFCFESNNILNGNYYINNNNFTNTLPIKRENMILNDYISNKIISVFIKDYEALKKFVNGKYLSLKEQIEIGAKNSEDGCIYLQLILPKNEYEKRNDTCPNDHTRFFEIRCKILEYNNYYNRGV